MRQEERELLLREDAPRVQTARERRQLEGLDEDLRSSPLRGKPLPLRLRNFRPDAEGYLASLGGPLPYMVRLREIEALITAHEQALSAVHHRLASETSPGELSEAWRVVAARWSFDEVNDLIARHNRWYPVESRLPMDPRRGDFALVNGRDYRLRPLDADWVLERYPRSGLTLPAQAGRRRAAPRDAATSVTAQSAPHSRYGTASPNAWASAPPITGPVSAPSAHAVFVAPNPTPWASPACSARSATSAIPGVKNPPNVTEAATTSPATTRGAVAKAIATATTIEAARATRTGSSRPRRSDIRPTTGLTTTSTMPAVKNTAAIASAP